MQRFPLKWIAVALLIAAAFALGTPPAFAGETEPSILTVRPTEPQRAWLQEEGFDLVGSSDQGLEVIATPEDRKRLEERGITIIAEQTIHLEDLKTTQSGYHTFEEYVAGMNDWTGEYPGLVTMSSIGETYEGRQLWMIKISDNAATNEDEPEVLVLGLQHAREWLSGATVHGIVERFLEAYGTDPLATDLVDSHEIFVVLVSNPDGYVYTHTNERLWRKNRTPQAGGAFGVDTNRNWPYKWETASNNPSSNVYRGPAPLSELENIHLNNFILSRGGEVVACLNYHAYGNLIMHNWAWTTTTAPNAETMGPLVNSMKAAIEAVNGENMDAGSWGVALGYTGGGVTDDTLHADYGIPTITIEVRPDDASGGAFIAPDSLIEPTANEHYAGFLEFLTWTRLHGTDTTPPQILNLQAVELDSSRVEVSWQTDDPADRAVVVKTDGEEDTEVAPDHLRGRNHSVLLTGLDLIKRYRLEATSTNLAGLSSMRIVYAGSWDRIPQDDWVLY